MLKTIDSHECEKPFCLLAVDTEWSVNQLGARRPHLTHQTVQYGPRLDSKKYIKYINYSHTEQYISLTHIIADLITAS